jgi:hypothetical protein
LRPPVATPNAVGAEDPGEQLPNVDAIYRALVEQIPAVEAHIKEKLSLRSARELVQHAVQWNVREKTA